MGQGDRANPACMGRQHCLCPTITLQPQQVRPCPRRENHRMPRQVRQIDRAVDMVGGTAEGFSHSAQVIRVQFRHIGQQHQHGVVRGQGRHARAQRHCHAAGQLKRLGAKLPIVFAALLPLCSTHAGPSCEIQDTRDKFMPWRIGWTGRSKMLAKVDHWPQGPLFARQVHDNTGLSHGCSTAFGINRDEPR